MHVSCADLWSRTRRRSSAISVASIVVGVLLGAASVFGATLMIQQDTKPPLQPGDPASSVLNRVEYGNRG